MVRHNIKNMNFRKIEKYYEVSLAKFKRGPNAVNWKDKKTQELRFKKLCEVGNLKNKKVLDVGCGLGEFYNYLKKKKIKCKYLGLDISQKMIDSIPTNNRNKNFKVEKINILELSQRELKILQCDFVISSGIFTVKSSYNNKFWWKHIQKMILAMYKLTKIGMVFNLMKPNVNYKDNHLYYQSIDQLITFLEKKVSKKIILKFDYPLWEFMCYVYK